MPTRLKNLEIHEVSFVDRPANPESRIVLFKRDGFEDGEEIEFELGKGLPDSSDVMEDEVLGSDDKKRKRKRGKKSVSVIADTTEKSYSGDEDDPTEERMPDEDATQDQSVEIDTEYVKALEDQVLDLQDQLASTQAELEKRDAPAEDDTDDLLKNADPEIVRLVKSAQERAEEAEEIAKAEREARITKEYVEKAAPYVDSFPVDADTLGSLIRKMGDQEPEFIRILDAMKEAVDVAHLTKEFGTSGGGMTAVEEEIRAKAQEIQKNDSNKTYEQAYAQVLEEHPDLYERTLTEER